MTFSAIKVGSDHLVFRSYLYRIRSLRVHEKPDDTIQCPYVIDPIAVERVKVEELLSQILSLKQQ